MSVLSPFVYWAQNEQSIFLKIDLKDAKNPNIDIQCNSISFSSFGTGSFGSETYSFHLKFFNNIHDDEDNIIKINGNSVNLTLIKKEPGFWPRLISAPHKPLWLKIDFDKWQSEDDLLDEKVNNITEDFPDVYKNLMKNELGYVKEDFKAVYLLIYNLCMLSGFIYAAVILIATLTKYNYEESTQNVYPAIGRLMGIFHLFMCLEIMHPIFGYVKGSAIMPLLQIFGRLFILFGNLEFEPRLQKMPATTWLFIAWIFSDIIRYIYYIFHTATTTNSLTRCLYPIMKWLRYSAWIILYPIGFICESTIIFRNILYLHQNPRFYLRMPNNYNATFDYLTFLRIYMLFIMFPAMYSLIKHMYSSRIKQLGGGQPFDKLNLFKNKVQ